MDAQTIKDIFVRTLENLHGCEWKFFYVTDFRYDNKLRGWVIRYKEVGRRGRTYSLYEYSAEIHFNCERLEEFVKYYNL